MNEELTLQDLTDLLVKRHDMERADAEAFVKLFFSLIEKGLSSDRYVKIKGLGTFKLIDTRVVFTPDSSMKDLVNKPFSHFETVVLNDKTHFDDVTENEEDVVDVAADEAEKNIQKCNQIEPVAEECESVALQESARQQSSFSSRLPWCMIASVLLVGAIAGGFMVWSMFRSANPVEKTSPESTGHGVIAQQDSMTRYSLAKDSLKVDSDAIDKLQFDSRSVVVASSVQGVEKKSEILSDTVTYAIVGTRTVHQLLYGETLVKLALRYYGNKKMWPYIARYNKETLKNADNIHVGTMIRIPELSSEKNH